MYKAIKKIMCQVSQKNGHIFFENQFYRPRNSRWPWERATSMGTARQPYGGQKIYISGNINDNFNYLCIIRMHPLKKNIEGPNFTLSKQKLKT